MTTLSPPVLPDSRWETLRVLLLVQASIFTVSLFEAAIAAIAFPSPVGVVGTGLFVGVVLSFTRAAGRGRIVRPLFWVERSLIVWYLVDTALSVALAHRPLEMVPTLTRLALPIVILRLAKQVRP